jgi:transposase
MMNHEPRELRTFILHLLPSTCAVRLTEMTIEPTYVLLQLTTTAPTACCPRYAAPSTSAHSRYQRQLMDLPWGARSVRIRLKIRKFVYRNPTCGRRIFTERLPALVVPYARKTQRLVAPLQAIGMALGGQAGARLTHRLGFLASRDTLLRLVRRLPLPVLPPLRTIGVDDWAHRKRQRYGTSVVDLERRRPVALLHNREADTLVGWLRQHAGIAIIARDRMKAYNDGARAGAPQAIQVADRFHLLQNLAEALDQVFSAHGSALRAVGEVLNGRPVVQPDRGIDVPVPPPTPMLQTQTASRAAPGEAAHRLRPRLEAVPSGLVESLDCPATGHWSYDRRAPSPGSDVSRAQRPRRCRQESPDPL